MNHKEAYKRIQKQFEDKVIDYKEFLRARDMITDDLKATKGPDIRYSPYIGYYGKNDD